MLSAAAFHAIVYAALTGTHIAVAVGAWVLANRTKIAPVVTAGSAVAHDLQTNAPMSQLAADVDRLASSLAKLGIAVNTPAPAPAPDPTAPSSTSSVLAQALDLISKKFHLVPRLDPAPTPAPTPAA